MKFEKVKNIIIKRLQSDLSNNLCYHNLDHTLSVLKAVEIIAEYENIDDYELVLLKTAAILHDSGFLLEYNQNEPIACDISRKLLPEYEYNYEEIERICNIIMATAIPQNPKNHLEKILCDADLDYLGNDKPYNTSEKLRKELFNNGRPFIDKEWLQFEVTFLEKHHYFTSYSLKFREEEKNKYLKDLKNELFNL